MVETTQSPTPNSESWADSVRRALAFALTSDLPAAAGAVKRASAPPHKPTARTNPLPISARSARRKYWEKFLEDPQIKQSEATSGQVRAVIERLRFEELSAPERLEEKAAPSPTAEVKTPPPPAASIDAGTLADAEAAGDEGVSAQAKEMIERLREQAAPTVSALPPQAPEAHAEIPKEALSGATASPSVLSAGAMRERAAFAGKIIKWDERIAYWRRFLADGNLDAPLRDNVETLIDLLTGRSQRQAVLVKARRRPPAITSAPTKREAIAARLEHWDGFLRSLDANHDGALIEKAGALRAIFQAIGDDSSPGASNERSTDLERLSEIATRFKKAWDVDDNNERRPGALVTLEKIIEEKREKARLDPLLGLRHSLGPAVIWFEADPDLECGLFESLPSHERQALGSYANCAIRLAEPEFYPELLFASFQDRRYPAKKTVAFAFDPEQTKLLFRLSGDAKTIYRTNRTTQFALSPETALRYAAFVMDFVFDHGLRVDETPTPGTKLSISEDKDHFRLACDLAKEDQKLALELRIDRRDGRIEVYNVA